MTVLEKIKRCVSLVWDFQEIYGEEDIEDFCHNELSTYPQHDEIMEYFKRIQDLEKSCDETQELLDKQIEATYKLVEENAELKKQQFSLRNERNTFLAQNEQYEKDLIDFNENLIKAKKIIKGLLELGSIGDGDYTYVAQAEQFLKEVSE